MVMLAYFSLRSYSGLCGELATCNRKKNPLIVSWNLTLNRIQLLKKPHNFIHITQFRKAPFRNHFPEVM